MSDEIHACIGRAVAACHADHATRTISGAASHSSCSPVRAVGGARSARHARISLRSRHGAAHVRSILLVLGAGVMAVGWFTEGVAARALLTIIGAPRCSSRRLQVRRLRPHHPGLDPSPRPCWSTASSLAVVRNDGPRRPVRGPFFITLSMHLFAVSIRPLGLVIASYLSIVAPRPRRPKCAGSRPSSGPRC